MTRLRPSLVLPALLSLPLVVACTPRDASSVTEPEPGSTPTTAAMAATQTLVLSVAPTGDDAADGSAARPLASLAGARDAVRRARAAGRTGPVRVVLQDGTYTLREPLVLGPQDGGTADAPVTYEAAPGATPVISGGRRITGFRPAGDGVWAAQVPEVAAGSWYFEQLFVAGQRAVRARTPNQRWNLMGRVEEEALGPVENKRATSARQTVTVDAADAALLASVPPEALRDVHLVAYHKWDATRRPVASFDAAGGRVSTLGRGMKPWNPWQAGTPYILENFKAACDAPGEWFLGRDGVLLYRPLPGQDMATVEVIAPVSERLLVIRGTTAAPVAHVTFQGLAFRHGQWLTPAAGVEPIQAAANIDAALQIDGARQVTFDRCEISHLGNYGLWFHTGCTDSTVRECFLHDLGAGGIRIGEVAGVMNPAEPTQRIVVDNSIIRSGGWIFPSAVGVWIGASPDNTITHNDIADLDYTGISVGWRWGYGPSTCKRNTIAANHIHHVGKGRLADLGGIYTLGPSEGTVVRGNVLHDITSYSYGGWGLYTDEGSTGILFENNLVYRTKDGSFHQHFGKDNIIRNNILVDSAETQVKCTKAEDHRSFTFEGNIIAWSTGNALRGAWDKAQIAGGRNCWFPGPGALPEFLGKTFAQWQAAGHDAGSVIADPRFLDPAHQDYRVPADSPAVALGFTPFDPAQAGVYGAASWKALARDWVPRPVFAPPATPGKTATPVPAK